MSGFESLYTLVLSRRSILDTLFLFKTPHGLRAGPAYATTTEGPVTKLWRIDNRGKMSEVSRIIWPSTTAQPHQLLINGQLMLVDDVLQRSKSLFGSASRTFVAGNTRFKWKRGKAGSLNAEPAHQSIVGTSIYTQLQAWTCFTDSVPSKSHRPGTSSSHISAPPPVALFFPPQSGFLKSELTIYPDGEAIVDHIVLTALLLCARKDEWRSSRTPMTPHALEATLRADIGGSLPPYLPTTPPRSRRPPSNRRPHTANAIATRGTSFTQTPPPYTSVDDVSLRPPSR